jgi:hypothetical protein
MGTIAATWSTSDTRLAILAGAIVGLIIWILISYFVGRAADHKNRSFTSFFLIAFFVSPIIGAVIVAALPPSTEMLIANGRRKACSNCGEAIMPSAPTMPTLRPRSRSWTSPSRHVIAAHYGSAMPQPGDPYASSFGAARSIHPGVRISVTPRGYGAS